jgi:hypothetical protein
MIKLFTSFFFFCTFTILAEDIVKISVLPTKINLNSARSCAQILVTGFTQDGRTIDLSRKAKFTHDHTVKIDNAYVSPLANGKSSIRVEYGSLSKNIPLTVQSTDKNDPVSFNWETLAILTKQGCNGGGCHGKPNGRGALELSLNAFDPDFDETNLIRGAMGRFLQPISPDKSLLLKKPTMQVGHVGGKRLTLDTLQYDLLLQWIKEGAKSDKGQKKLKSLKVFPNDRALEFPNQDQQLSVWAFFEDGSFKDVTRISTYSTSHKRVATVDDNGLVSGHDRGQSAISVRYIDDVVTVNFTMVKKVKDFKWQAPKEHNYIDTLVNNKLRQLQYLPANTIDDATFIRRLSLDTRGQLPSTQETQKFIGDKNPKKRSLLIDQYLESDAFARFYAMKIADLLKVNTNQLTPGNAANYSRWIHKTTKANMPFDKFTAELLLSKGHTDIDPRANFFRTTKDSKMVTESVSQLFMGSRLTCAQCHNHPYESWTQDNYYQITSAFNNIDRVTLAQEKGNEPNKKTILIYANKVRNTANPRTKIHQKPWPIDVNRDSKDDPRDAFVQWLTAKNNPYFAKTEVNRIWSYLLGRGIVMPVDDFRPSNPPTNIELLDALAKDFVSSGYDRKHMFRQILNSQTYQRSTETNIFNKDDSELFSHARPRLLSAEQVKDAILLLCAPPKESQVLADQKSAQQKSKQIKQLKSNLDQSFPKWIKLTQEDLIWRDLKAKQASQFIQKSGYKELSPNEFIETSVSNTKNENLGTVRSYHPLENGNLSALRFVFAKNAKGKFGNGQQDKFGISKQRAWIISKGLGTKVKSIEIEANRDNAIGEIDLLMDGKNLNSIARFSDSQMTANYTQLSDGKFNAVKTTNKLKIEFPTETDLQFLTLHLHHNAKVKFFNQKAELVHEASITSNRRLDTTTIGLPSVKKIDISAAQYWEMHGKDIRMRKINKDGQWLPHSVNIEPNYAITFKAIPTRKGQSLVLEQNHLDKKEGLFAKYKIQFSDQTAAIAQLSLEKNILVIAKKFDASEDWEKNLVRYKYYQTSPQYNQLKNDWSKVQGKLDKIFATQKLYPEKSKLLTAFGQPERETVCACERPEAVALDQSLQLMNGQYIKTKLEKIRYNKKVNDADNVTELYLNAYSRKPKSEELTIATNHLSKATNKDLALRDLYWVIINSNEFIFQH